MILRVITKECLFSSQTAIRLDEIKLLAFNGCLKTSINILLSLRSAALYSADFHNNATSDVADMLQSKLELESECLMVISIIER